MANGTIAWPARSPMLRNDVARPRWRTNQLAIATALPRFTPVSAAVRPAANSTMNCQTSCTNARPSSDAETISPETTTDVRAPYLSIRAPTTGDSSEPSRLPPANARDISPNDHPRSWLMGVRNTDSTGPYTGTWANDIATVAATMPQP